ncbi:hypothetical protein QBC34DRAFT_446105 [Podospora aff. communis PSN243]|uniref:CID domain-containing protein n=1 Tax=Podospora aff. communis PSN243 TaxID=3040156 RepID=A0AAV9H271_9PEZI|nr:hypothetical protein QBC34DRAFT_446105 [Podospora aff. communis PSN243]
MSSKKKIVEFPDVEAKLQKPSKQSAFERQKAEAEAKRRREAAETAAVYEDFVKSFDHDGDEDNGSSYGSRQAPSRYGSSAPERPPFGSQAPFAGGAGKRHFGIPSGTPIKSGPGSLGPVPSSFGRKRPHENFQSPYQRDADEGRGRLGFDDREPGTASLSRAFVTSDDEDEKFPASGRAEEKAISKPTLRLANLPPGTSPAFVKALIPSNLTVENVRIVPPSGPGGTERKSIAAIVTLSKETPATEIDAAVSALQNRYLGFGFFLSLHRHLSSAAIASGLAAVSSTAAVAHPFGAKRVEEPIGGPGPQSTGYGRGYAPPTSYGPPAGGPVGRNGLLHVPIRPPRDIKKLRMIHKVIESVLEHGPEFEALLMSRPDVQRDENWAWIWDARSEGGIWYRWRLWEIVTGSRSKEKYIPLFEGSHAWKAPAPLPYEYTTEIDQFVSDPEYNSSDEEDFEDEQARQVEVGGGAAEQEDTFLNPIEKSKLTHLLARLPTTLSKIRKGDIARVTTFAITHASRGADEIVDLIASNIEHPFAYTSANPHYKLGMKEKEGADEDSRDASPAADDKTATDAPDMSAARLLGLYVISDILSSSSTSGIRHAWRYRQLFETALRSRKTFEVLGSMADRLNWGRLRAEKWKRSVGLVLNLWEGWCVFPLETHALFVSSFENPPLPPKESNGGEDPAKKGAGRWKPVEASGADGGSSLGKTGSGFLPVSDQETGGQPEQGHIDSMLETGDTDGELRSPRMQYSSGLDELFSDDDLDGEPDEDFIAFFGAPVGGEDVTMGGVDETSKDEPSTARSETKSIAGFQMSAVKLPTSRKRMRAVDMFAGSDSDGET